MPKSGVLTVAFLALFVDAFFFTTLVSGSFPKAQNVTWQSTNFKTRLTWEPKPSSEYSYTVEFSVAGQNREKNKFCIRTTETECDLTGDLTDVKASYSADVLSEPPLGVTSDVVEFPHTRSPRFCPYKDTDIGDVGDFKIVQGDRRNVTLYVSDPQTALFRDGRALTIRDVFADDLQYKVTYRRAQSSGQKVKISKSSEIEVTGLDRGESYCFQVQAYIPSRRADKQLGAESRPQCTHKDNPSFLEKYSVGAIAGGILLLLALVGVVVGVAVCCIRRRRNGENPREKAEGAEPLRGGANV